MQKSDSSDSNVGCFGTRQINNDNTLSKASVGGGGPSYTGEFFVLRGGPPFIAPSSVVALGPRADPTFGLSGQLGDAGVVQAPLGVLTSDRYETCCWEGGTA